MNINFKMDKETAKMVGSKALGLSKMIVIEGIKTVTLKSAANVIETSFDKGFGGVKELTFDEVVGLDKKKNKPKKLGLFGRRKAVTEEQLEEVVENVVENQEELDQIIEKAKKVLEDKDQQ